RMAGRSHVKPEARAASAGEPSGCYARFRAPSSRPCWISVSLAYLQGGCGPGGALPTANDPSPPCWGSEIQTLANLSIFDIGGCGPATRQIAEPRRCGAIERAAPTLSL